MKEAVDFITANWGDDGKKVIDTCRDFNLNMTINEFVNKHCTACGGNWGGMFLTGIKKLAPAVYDAIPDDMDVNRGISEVFRRNRHYSDS